MSKIDYSRWNNIEISDDEDEVHPNIDTPSLFRWRHQARMDRMAEAEAEKKEFEAKKAELLKKKAVAEEKKLKGEDLGPLQEELSKTEKEIQEREAELNKKEKLTPWNVDTIGQDGFSKTVINAKPIVKEELTDEERAKRLKDFTLKNEKKLKEFGLLRKFEDSRRFLLEHPHLTCEDTTNYLTIWCVNLALEEKFDLMDHVSHQCIAMQFLLELAKQVDRDPRSCTSDFYSKIAHAEQTEYKRAFDEELEAFRKRIRIRAEEKLEEARREVEEEERQKRLGPGGLDPIEVFESLPDELKKCFESQDIPLLQETISKMPEEEARAHMKRCVDSGLWVPDAKSVSEAETVPDTGLRKRNVGGGGGDDEDEDEDN
jgi:cell division cycle protein 37